NLHERLALQGPDDDLRELAETIDGLFARLDASFDAQRQFIANASHELRTPLARSRTLLEVALRNPEVSAESLRTACERVLAAGAEQEHRSEERRVGKEGRARGGGGLVGGWSSAVCSSVLRLVRPPRRVIRRTAPVHRQRLT